MKKTLLVLLAVLISFGLFGCEKEEEPIEQPTDHNIPQEQYVNLQELPYSQYLNLTNPVVTITVEGMGDIVIQLFPQVAPNTVNSFISYIQAGVYTDNEFHRVILDFMIQGGQIEDPSCEISGEMTSNDFENLLLHDRGVISMARIGGDYDSASSQFFIMHAKSNFLNDEYATFGGMVSGFNVLDYIANLNDGVSELPSIYVSITSITVDLKGKTYDEPICIVSDVDTEE
ncbi:MAG: peptidylprolyl isomerase [Candidatus Izimaplasma sp.]|nr:peptidylprolyl isomerase [Candidatus Izimaplasma bacterium]